MVSVCKLGGTIDQTGVKGGKSKRTKIPPQSLSFPFSPRPRFSRLAARGSRRTTHRSFVTSFDRSKNARKRKRLLAVYKS